VTRYIAAYDTEKAADCLAACWQIRQVHERFGLPATFFITGERLEQEGTEFAEALGPPARGDQALFEIASHTFSHQMLRDHPFCGPAVGLEARLQEIRWGKILVEQIFDRPCWGLRPGCGFVEGLRGDPWLVEMVAEAGYGYVSSLLWGPEYTVPALLEPPFSYAEEGHPDLWEMPGHGWHENLLKGHNLTDRPQRIVAWPSPFPEAVPLVPIQTPEQEFAVNRLFIDRAVALELPYVSLIWHPWSLRRFDPEYRMLEMTFRYVRELGLEATTYEREWRRVQAQQFSFWQTARG
jgi:peptidoglycan/xylan/chitin deacetylase (PgdA/CDA1 family)